MNINQVIIQICQYFATKMDRTLDKAYLSIGSYKDILHRQQKFTLTVNVSKNNI